MVDALTVVPVAAAQAAQGAASVASGRAPTWASNSGCCARPIAGVRPGRERGAISPGSRRCRQRKSVVRWTPKREATPPTGRPASTCRSARSRRSREYCFTPAVSPRTQLLRKTL